MFAKGKKKPGEFTKRNNDALGKENAAKLIEKFTISIIQGVAKKVINNMILNHL